MERQGDVLNVPFYLCAVGLLAWVARFMSVCRWAGNYFTGDDVGAEPRSCHENHEAVCAAQVVV